MMKDALAFAHRRQYSFLLLLGIPDYYQQHGFSDVIGKICRNTRSTGRSFQTGPLNDALCVTPNSLTLLLCLLCIWNIMVPRCVLLPPLVR